MNKYRVRVTHEDRGSLSEADAHARTLRAFINVVTGLEERQEYDWVSACWRKRTTAGSRSSTQAPEPQTAWFVARGRSHGLSTEGADD